MALSGMKETSKRTFSNTTLLPKRQKKLSIAIHAKSSKQCMDAITSMDKLNAGRMLFVVFELKETVARVISVRDMDKKERKIYKS
jgi:uncharacterized DUF497 family protein